LVTIATSLGLLRILRQFYNPHKCLYQSWNVGEDRFSSCWDRLFSETGRFLPFHFKSTNFSPINLWCYWTKVHHICTWCRGIIFAIYLLIHIAIFNSVLKCQGAEWRLFCQFCSKLVAMATSLEYYKNLARIDNIHANTFHLVKKNRDNQSTGSWDSFAQIKKKLRKVKYIDVARSASLPIGLKKSVYIHEKYNRKSNGLLSVEDSVAW